MKDILFNLFKKSSIGTYPIIFAGSELSKNKLILKGDEVVLIQIEDCGNDLMEIVNKKSRDVIADCVGIYSADLKIHGYLSSGHPEDPPEWDMDVWVENIKKLDFEL